MAIRDEIKEEQKKLRGKGAKAKIQYFFDYYTFQTVAVIVLLIGLSVFIHDVVTRKDTKFYAMLLNAGSTNASVSADDLQSQFSGLIGLNTEKEESIIDVSLTYNRAEQSQYSMAASEKLAALFAAGSIDVMVADPDNFSYYAENGALQDLSTFFTEEELAEYKDRLVYADAAAVQGTAAESAAESAGETESAAADSRTAQVPVGIRLPEDCFLFKEGYYSSKEAVYGIVVRAEHTDSAKRFLAFLESGS